LRDDEELEEEVIWDATDDEMDGETLVDLKDSDPWEGDMSEDSGQEENNEEMRTWQIDNL